MGARVNGRLVALESELANGDVVEVFTSKDESAGPSRDWLAFVRSCPMALHIRLLAGENTHHILEAVFKGTGRALRMAAALDEKHRDEIPSTKGVL